MKFLALLPIVFIFGCSNAQMSSMQSWGADHHVVQYSGGVKIGEWTAHGKIENEESSDGYFFMDAKTGKPVMISGTVQITLE